MMILAATMIKSTKFRECVQTKDEKNLAMTHIRFQQDIGKPYVITASNVIKDQS